LIPLFNPYREVKWREKGSLARGSLPDTSNIKALVAFGIANVGLRPPDSVFTRPDRIENV